MEGNSAEEINSRDNLEDKKEVLLNALNFFVHARISQTPLNRLMALDAFRLLRQDAPEKKEIIQELDALQSDEGTWKKGHEHYVPTTAQALSFYKYNESTPQRSLEPFLATIDTWDKTVAHNERYQPGNYWGGLWGYVGSYVALGQKPPWAEIFIKEVHERFNEWSLDNHQRSHVIDSLRQLQEPIPQPEQLIKLILEQQMPDGQWTAAHWNAPLPQTAFGIGILKILQKQNSPGVNDAINRGLKFIDQCFKTIQYKGKEYGGYAMEPDHPYPDPLATLLAIAAQLHPEELEELLGYYNQNAL